MSNKGERTIFTEEVSVGAVVRVMVTGEPQDDDVAAVLGDLAARIRGRAGSRRNEYSSNAEDRLAAANTTLPEKVIHKPAVLKPPLPERKAAEKTARLVKYKPFQMQWPEEKRKAFIELAATGADGKALGKAFGVSDRRARSYRQRWKADIERASKKTYMKRCEACPATFTTQDLGSRLCPACAAKK